MQIRPRSFHILIGAIAVMLSISGCTKRSFSIGDSKTSSQSVSSFEPTPQANDRPTEAGTGVPGYLVCSLFTVQDDNVQVGCNVSDTDGAKIVTPADSWTRYDVNLPTDTPYGVSLTKAVASDLKVWDVNFNFKGSTKDVLSDVARKSTYGYVYVNDSGQSVRIETAPPPTTPTPVAMPTPAPLTCSGGAFVDNVCFVPVDSSCTDYCDRAAMQPHPYVINRFGVSRDTDDDVNKRNCHDLFAQIRNTDDFRFIDINSSHGWGCFEEYSGRVVFDKEITRLFEYPRIGDRRICGCQ